MSKETIDAQAVMDSVGKIEVHPSFVQKAGLWLAAGVGALIAGVTFAVIYFLISNYPPIQTPESLKILSSDPQLAIQLYKELSSISVKSALDIFQTIVSQALLPILTAILGYVFAKGINTD